MAVLSPWDSPVPVPLPVPLPPPCPLSPWPGVGERPVLQLLPVHPFPSRQGCSRARQHPRCALCQHRDLPQASHPLFGAEHPFHPHGHPLSPAAHQGSCGLTHPVQLQPQAGPPPGYPHFGGGAGGALTRPFPCFERAVHGAAGSPSQPSPKPGLEPERCGISATRRRRGWGCGRGRADTGPVIAFVAPLRPC